MKLKKSGGSAVIVTLPGIVTQWKREIMSVTRCDEKDITEDINNTAARWVVISYQKFSKAPPPDDTDEVDPAVPVDPADPTAALLDKEAESILQTIERRAKNGEIKIAILDEIHSVKNRSANRTERILDVTKFIPTVWGATATMVAKTPLDVYTQLRAVNHKLGKLPFATFAQELCGMQPAGYGAWEPISIEHQVAAANKLKEWLVNFGVFIQRTKKDFRPDMPDKVIDRMDTVVNPSTVSDYFADKIRNRNQNKKFIPVTAMLFMREALAVAKTIHTAKEAKNLLSQGKKVAIFTTFREPAARMKNYLNAIMAVYGGGYTVMITGGMNQKKRDTVLNDFKNPSSKARAMILMIKAGGTGLDVPNVTNDVFVNDFDWTPADAEQSEGRFFRINSKDNVNIKYIIAQGTDDEEYYERVRARIAIAEIIQTLSKEQMELLTKGARRGNKELEEVKKKMVEAVKKQAELEKEQNEFTIQEGDKLVEEGNKVRGAEDSARLFGQ